MLTWSIHDTICKMEIFGQFIILQNISFGNGIPLQFLAPLDETSWRSLIIFD